jgi:BMFP domain-containing protein YqiC
MLRDMDIATREEVEVLRDMLDSLRAENERLAARVQALETRLDINDGVPPAAPGISV